jgi:hypothetical protein
MQERVRAVRAEAQGTRALSPQTSSYGLRVCEVGALLIWMNDQDVAARLARHRLTDALTE